ncbi:MAG TPA: DNA polymerase III subunit gamma/tau [Chloroflexia bacterium]|nr:DNA polymerase III subunit gamma/tau [Chloroflexia bacterium]
MAGSTSLYRKYRSQTFDELVGQEPVVKTLKNAIATGRIGHAYLFTGPRGVGKTSAARLLARAANCLSDRPDKPCNECDNCLAANRDIATDLIEIDAASNTGVDNIREVIERAQFSPAVWRTKWYIVDEVHMLSVSAFNALLKTLEEPPPHVAFILATTEVHKVPATVASRCQRFDFRRVPLKAMVDRLRYICEQESIEIEDAALEIVARQATGSLRDALSLMDQLRVYAEGGITVTEVQNMLGASGSERVADFVDHLVAGDLAAGLRAIASASDDGLDVRQFNRQVVEHLRGLMLVKTGAAEGEGAHLDVTGEMRRRMSGQAKGVALDDLVRWIHAFADADANLRATTYRTLPLELALVMAISPPAAPRAEQLAPTASGAEPAAPVRADAPRPPVHREPPPARETRPAPAEPAGPPPPIYAELGQALPPSEPVEVAGVAPDARPGPNGHEMPPAADEPAEDSAPLPGESELDRLKRLWPRLVEQLNARSKQMAAVFAKPDLVRPYSVSGNVCTISFRDSFYAQRSRGDQQRKLLEYALTKVLGYNCLAETITFDQEASGGDGNPAPKKGGPKEKPPAPHETPRGRAAMNIFGIQKFDEDE